MGNQLNFIKQHANKKNSSSLLGVSLSKVRDFHASFKSICDNFSMDLSEFEHIFGASESAFVIWDTDNNGLIDSLELFSGIILFSDTKFEDKIRFLFDIFDFNELDSLALVDIEFMIYSCCSATNKIFSINSDEMNTEEIAAFVKKNFNMDIRITVVNLLKAAQENEEIKQFFQLIKMDQPNVEIKSTKDEKNLNKLFTGQQNEKE